jgi:ABC-type bacteriocin/lantibiotic exporter with double-glycine peptidase domain
MYHNSPKKFLPLLILCIALLSCGCASYAIDLAYTELVKNRQLTEKDIHSEETYVLDIPVKKQKSANCCGIACLEMVLSYWAEPAKQTLNFNIENNDCPKNGFTGKELKEMAIIDGYNAFVYKGDLKDIYKNLSAARPIIVILKIFGSNHYVVVSGYSQNGNLVINNPSEGRMFWDLEDFMDRWKKANYFSMLILPKKA